MSWSLVPSAVETKKKPTQEAKLKQTHMRNFFARSAPSHKRSRLELSREARSKALENRNLLLHVLCFVGIADLVRTKAYRLNKLALSIVREDKRPWQRLLFLRPAMEGHSPKQIAGVLKFAFERFDGTELVLFSDVVLKLFPSYDLLDVLIDLRPRALRRLVVASCELRFRGHHRQLERLLDALPQLERLDVCGEPGLVDDPVMGQVVAWQPRLRFEGVFRADGACRSCKRIGDRRACDGCGFRAIAGLCGLLDHTESGSVQTGAHCGLSMCIQCFVASTCKVYRREHPRAFCLPMCWQCPRAFDGVGGLAAEYNLADLCPTCRNVSCEAHFAECGRCSNHPLHCQLCTRTAQAPDSWTDEQRGQFELLCPSCQQEAVLDIGVLDEILDLGVAPQLHLSRDCHVGGFQAVIEYATSHDKKAAAEKQPA